jgi:phosphoglycolate phosphatase
MDRAPCLLFDLDGTLIDSAVDIAAALSELTTVRGGQRVSPEIVRPLVSKGVEILVSNALGALVGDIIEDVAEFRRVLASRTADPSMIYPGVVAALADLANLGRRMAVVTNKPEALSKSLLDHFDLTHYFGAVVGGDTFQAGKPDAMPVLGAIAALGGVGQPAVFIGDSAVDADAAFAASVPFVLFEGGYGPIDIQTSRIAGRFSDFRHLVDCLAAVDRGISV